MRWLALLLLVLPVDATAADAPPPLSEFEIIQYINSDGFSPEPVIRLDDNGEIVRACIPRAMSAAELRQSGLAVTDSQLVLLQAMRVLRKSDGKYIASLPFLFGARSAALRTETNAFAAELVPLIEPDVRELVAELAKRGRQRNAYSIVFSYVLDGKVWDVLDSEGATHVRNVSAAEPHWSGETWGIHPRRPFDCGTNSTSSKGFSLMVNWSRPLLPQMGPFLQHDGLDALQSALHAGGVLTPEAATRFAAFAIAGADRKLTIPVIDESDADDPLTAVSRRIAVKIAHACEKSLGSQDVASRYQLRDAEQALIIAYHEAMWDLLARLEAEKVIVRPRALATPEAAQPSDIADLVFAVRTK